MRANRPSRSAAFTLVELLVVDRDHRDSGRSAPAGHQHGPQRGAACPDRDRDHQHGIGGRGVQTEVRRLSARLLQSRPRAAAYPDGLAEHRRGGTERLSGTTAYPASGSARGSIRPRRSRSGWAASVPIRRRPFTGNGGPFLVAAGTLRASIRIGSTACTSLTKAD